LFVPGFQPNRRANFILDKLEFIAHRVTFSLGLDTLEVINVVDPAAAGCRVIRSKIES
jgi:hypothetical protein